MQPRHTKHAGIFNAPRYQHVKPARFQFGLGSNLRDRQFRFADHLQRFFKKVRRHSPIVKYPSRSCQGTYPSCHLQIGSIFPAGERTLSPMSAISAVFARNLATLLKREDISNADLGRRAGVSGRVIGMWLHEDSVPGIDSVEKVARVFGCTAWELLHPQFDPDKMHDARFKALCQAYLCAGESERTLMSKQADYILLHHPETCGCPKQ